MSFPVEGGSMFKLSIKKVKSICSLASALVVMPVFGQNVAYIYGDVAANGNIPSGNAAPFHQMLLTDTGARGTSEFRELVQNEGYQIDQVYDRSTNLTNAFLNQYDVIVFGLHQRIWSAAARNRLHNWINAGGSIMVYSDSAAGGRFNIVGSDNTVGQASVNSIISRYGMQVTVDQAAGTIANRSGNNNHPIVAGNLILEGEGVSPVAVAPNSGVQILIPYRTNVVSGNPSLNRVQNITINNPTYAALAIQNVGDGHVVAMYDRQPVWNNGEGSDITRRDNRVILRNIMRFLAPTENSGDRVVNIVKRNAPFGLHANQGFNGGALNLHSNLSHDNLHFREIDRGNGFYSFQRLSSNHSIDGGNGGGINQNVHVWTTSANNFNQHWRRVASGGGSFTLRKRNASSFGIHGGGVIRNLSNVNMHSNLSHQNLHWFIRE